MYTKGLVSLTALERKDLPQLMQWRNIPEYRKHFREYRELNMFQQETWFQDKVIKDNDTLMFAIRQNKNQALIGCCGLVYIDWIHRHADLSLYIGYDDLYVDNIGFCEESCRLLLGYGFEELGLNKVWTEIYEFDKKKDDLYTKIGFKKDGVLRQNYFFKNKWWDSKILSILQNEFLKKPGKN